MRSLGARTCACACAWCGVVTMWSWKKQFMMKCSIGLCLYIISCDWEGLWTEYSKYQRTRRHWSAAYLWFTAELAAPKKMLLLMSPSRSLSIKPIRNSPVSLSVVVYAFTTSTQEVEAGGPLVSLRPAWFTERVPDSQSHTEKPCLENQGKKARMSPDIV